MDNRSSLVEQDQPQDKQPTALPAGPRFLATLEEEIDASGGEWQERPEYEGAVGRTMFDLPSSKNNVVSVLLPRDMVGKIPAQSLVRINSLDDGRLYQGIVVEGPFHEPDGLRADSPIVVVTTVRGATFIPKYHGRLHVEIIGEIIDGAVIPPRFRPLPNSPVFALSAEETAQALNVGGDVTLGLVIGHDDLEVGIPSESKAVLPRHVGVLGTTGAGKSTTIAGQIAEYQRAGMATILLDTEGEYTQINEPTDDPNMLHALQRRRKVGQGR